MIIQLRLSIKNIFAIVMAVGVFLSPLTTAAAETAIPLPAPVTAPGNTQQAPAQSPSTIESNITATDSAAAGAAKPAQAPVPGTEALSAFELYARGQHEDQISREIRQFGYDLFEREPGTFAPIDGMPVGPEYLLGPGDELMVSIWGKISGEHMLRIDREGKVNFPVLGLVQVAGLTFSEAKDYMEKEFGKYYKTPEVKMNVSMGRLRTIRIFVVGNVKKPGSYTVSSLSTLINALFAAGGPSKAGSMRNMQVKRGNKTVVNFDMYDFLLKGDKSKDIRLMPEDVIFIPHVGPLAGVAGNVKTPAIYELKGEASLKELIDMAGGINARGYLQRIQVERIFDHQAKTIFDLNLRETRELDGIAMQDGDIVKIFSIINVVTNPVELKGNVLRPGTYEWKQGLKIKDVIRDLDALLPDTYFDVCAIERLVAPDYHKEYLSVNLQKLMIGGDAKENIELHPYDKITVFNKWEIQDRFKVRVAGAVNRQGDYEFRPSMKLSDLVNLAGGLKYFASREAELTRVTLGKDGPETERISINFEEIMANPGLDIPLKEDDFLFVRSIPEWELYRIVNIGGQVKNPGKYTIKKGERLSSLIERAGGFTDRAYLKGLVFTRESVKQLQQKQLDESIDRLEQELMLSTSTSMETALSSEEALQQKAVLSQKQALLSKMRGAKAKGRIALDFETMSKFKDSPNDVTLDEGDSIFIPEKPDQVQVIGAVYNQTAFLYERDKDVDDYLRSAGGFTKNADKKEIYVLKLNGTAVSKRDAGILERFKSIQLDPGDTIVVPEDLEKAALMKDVKDLTQILYQIAVTAGVLIVAF
ncbi:MAG: SLBB domain-containing protein [Deltaproteobacteria bacterium]|nr:SLBB domain-containing protein [Deltaproteobacteria bacterium]